MTRHFIRHYAEMVIAMFVGMGVVLGALTAAGVEVESAELELLVMATSMTVPMVAWMRHRGHGWAPAVEMSAAMFVPTAAALPLLWAGMVSEHGALMIQHIAMFPAMLLVMLLRRDEYSHAHVTYA